MTQNSESSSISLLPDATGYDPIEHRLRANVRATIEALFEEALTEFSAASAIDAATTRPRATAKDIRLDS